MSSVAATDPLLYNEWAFLAPPRPEIAVPKAMLSWYETQQYFLELKKNGTCTVLGVSPDKRIYGYNRHGDPQTAWVPDIETPCLRKMKDLPNEWFVFAGELLHSKGTGHRDTLYLFDILVMNSKHLTGSTRISRKDFLHKLFKTEEGPQGYDYIDDRLWLAKPILKDFLQTFEDLDSPEDEGVVLKSYWAELEPCKFGANVEGQVKCRKRNKNVGY